MAVQHPTISIKIEGDTESAQKAVAAIRQTEKALEETRKEATRLGNETSEIGSRANAAFGKAANAAKMFDRGLGSAVKGLDAVKVGIASTGIGLLVQWVIQAIQYFNKFEIVGDAVAKAMAGLDAVLGKVVEGFTKLLSGDFAGFFEDITVGAARAAKANIELEGRLDDLLTQQEALGLEAQDAEGKIKALMVQVRDRTKTDKQRLDILTEIDKIEQVSFTRQLENLESIARAEQDRAALSSKMSAAAEAEFNREGTSVLRRQQLLTEFEAQNTTNRQKALEAAKQFISFEQQADVLREKSQLRRNALEQQRAEDLAKRREAAERFNATILKLDEAIANSGIAHAQAARGQVDLLNQASVEAYLRATEQIRALQDFRMADELRMAEQQAMLTATTEQQKLEIRARFEELARLQRATLNEQRLAEDEAFRQKQAEAQAKADEAELDRVKKQMDKVYAAKLTAVKGEEALTMQRMQYVDQEAASAVNAFGLIANATRENAELTRVFTIFQKSAALAQVMSSYAVTKATLAAKGAVLGPLGVFAFIASGIAAFIDIINTITSVPDPPRPGFARGVIGLDGPGSGTSDSIPARLSKGESVITAERTQQYRPLLEAIHRGELNPALANGILGLDDSRLLAALEVIAEKPGVVLNIDKGGMRFYSQRKGSRIEYHDARMAL